MMEDDLITNDLKETAVSSVNVDNSPSELLEKEQAELLPQDIVETEITRDQLSLGRGLLNWRTIVPLLIVIVALGIFAQKAIINLQKTLPPIQSATLLFFISAYVVY